MTNENLVENWNTPLLSIMLVTMGKQPLLKYAIESLIAQIDEADELVISINSGDPEVQSNVRRLIASVAEGGKIRVISPNYVVSVYEHYKFVLLGAKNDCTVIVHDDELYGAMTVSEIKKGFTHAGVNVVVGGMLRVEIYPTSYSLQEVTAFETEGVFDGLEWILSKEGLYPPFCFSALALRKSALDLRIFSSNGTAVDCLAVARQAIEGKVFQSAKVFATWLQLPTRNSRWWVLNPDLIPPWREFLEYYEKVGNVVLIQRALDAKKVFYKSLLKMLFIVGVANRNVEQIHGCLKKIGDINPLMEKLLSFTKWRWFFNLTGPVLLYTKTRSKKYLSRRKSENTYEKPPLDVLPEMWTAFITSATKLV